MSQLEKNDILFAHKALNIVAGLSANARRVAGAIIDHFNRKTGQCNPSVERLAKLLRVDRATVLRATAELCSEQCGLFTKLSHGGKFHTASYSPCWSAFRAIVNAWEVEMKCDKRTDNVAELRRLRSQDCDEQGRKTATQTNRRNQSNKPIEAVPVETQGSKSPSAQPVQPSQGLRKGREPQRQRHLMLPIAGGKQASHSQAARAGAERRWYGALQALGGMLSMQIMQGLGERPDVYALATEAELSRKGSGLPYVLDVLGGGAALRHG